MSELSRRGVALALGGAGVAAVAALTATPAHAAPPPRGRPHTPFRDVRQWGATGDGTTDDTAALQRALDSLNDGEGLYFPSGIYLVTTGTIDDFILKIRTDNIAILGESRETSVIRIKPNTGEYWGILGRKDGIARHWEIRDLGFDHNYQNNPLPSDAAHWRPTLRYTVACYPGISHGVSIDTIDVLNCDSVVSLYFPQTFDRGTNITVTNCRWLSAGRGASDTYDYDQSMINVAGENVSISDCVFEGDSWSRTPRTAIEVHADNFTCTGNVIKRFQVGINLTGMTRAGTDYALTCVGNSMVVSRFGIVAWSWSNSGDTDLDHGGAIGMSIVANTIHMRTDLYPAKYPQPRGAALHLFPGPQALRIRALMISNNTIVYGDGVNIPDLRADNPGFFAAICIAHNASPADTRTDQLTVSGNTVLNAPFAALSISLGVIQAFYASENSFLDCGINEFGTVGTQRGHVIILESSFLDAPVISGGRIVIAQDPTFRSVVYYRDRSPEPKPLHFSTSVDVRSAQLGPLTTAVMCHPSSRVLIESFLSGTPLDPTSAAAGLPGSRVTTDRGVVLEPLGDVWVSRATGTSAPTAGTHTVGSTVHNSAVAPGRPLGWVCITAGSPGTWKGFGQIDV
ncbi:glycosyl hydrolase family 28-related protein [Propionibacteriaceae bacterium Y2011]